MLTKQYQNCPNISKVYSYTRKHIQIMQIEKMKNHIINGIKPLQTHLFARVFYTREPKHFQSRCEDFCVSARKHQRRVL